MRTGRPFRGLPVGCCRGRVSRRPQSALSTTRSGVVITNHFTPSLHGRCRQRTVVTVCRARLVAGTHQHPPSRARQMSSLCPSAPAGLPRSGRRRRCACRSTISTAITASLPGGVRMHKMHLHRELGCRSRCVRPGRGSDTARVDIPCLPTFNVSPSAVVHLDGVAVVERCQPRDRGG